MTRPKIAFFDVLTQEEIVREMNDEEFKQYQLDIQSDLKLSEEIKAKAAARQAILDRLGLSEEEARLLLG